MPDFIKKVASGMDQDPGGRSSQKPLRDIGRELKVGALVTGAVLRSGQRVRITAQLIDPGTEAQIWARSFERDLSDVLSLQNEIVS